MKKLDRWLLHPFLPNGEILTRKTPFTLNNDGDAITLTSYIEGYIGELKYLNELTLKAVDAILSNSSSPPIFILQGDHGSPRIPGWETTILNAYYLPDKVERAMLYPTKSPVNSFRVILDSYFGASLPLLQDEAYYSDRDDPFHFQLQPDPNPKCKTLP